jgi:hypothetical protein
VDSLHPSGIEREAFDDAWDAAWPILTDPGRPSGGSVEQRIEVAFRDERRGEAGEVCLRELRNGDARVDEEELLIPPLVVLQGRR